MGHSEMEATHFPHYFSQREIGGINKSAISLLNCKWSNIYFNSFSKKNLSIRNLPAGTIS